MSQELRMKKYSKLLLEEIRRITDDFDKAHYLERKSRSIHSIYKMLRYKSKKYKEAIDVAQKELTQLTKSRHKYSNSSLVACTIAGRSERMYGFGTSLRVLESYNAKLKKKLETIDVIGRQSKLTGSKNVIGKCAEAKMANHILNANKKLEISDIIFTVAIRPRTLEKIDRCPNCTHVFGPEK